MISGNPFDIEFWTQAPALFIDFEASGLHPDSYPIEVGVYSSDNLKYESIISPARYWAHWCYNAQEGHGIERSKLIREGKSPSKVARQLNAMFAGKTLWADANNDRFWLEVLYEAASIEPTFEVVSLRAYATDDQWRMFKRALPPVTAHRALQDAKDIRNAWYKQIQTRWSTE